VVRVSFSHLDYNVVDLSRAVAFYDPLMHFLGFEKEADHPDWVLYNNGRMKLCLVQCEQRFADPPFHRKRPGLNHIAFRWNRSKKWTGPPGFCGKGTSPSSMTARGSFTTPSVTMPSFSKTRSS
jgi:hypothetical protein